MYLWLKYTEYVFSTSPLVRMWGGTSPCSIVVVLEFSWTPFPVLPNITQWHDSALWLAERPVRLWWRSQWERAAGDTNCPPPCCVSGGPEGSPVVNSRCYRPFGSSLGTDRSWKPWAVRPQPDPESEVAEHSGLGKQAESTAEREAPPRPRRQQQPPAWAPWRGRGLLPLPWRRPCPRSGCPHSPRSSRRCSSARCASTTSFRPSCSVRRVTWSATPAARSWAAARRAGARSPRASGTWPWRRWPPPCRSPAR